MPKPSPIGQEFADAADVMALRAVAFLVARDGAFSAFAAATGCDPADLPRLIGDRSFLASVLDFVLSDESIAAAFSSAENLPPGALGDYRRGLPGGDLPHWT